MTPFLIRTFDVQKTQLSPLPASPNQGLLICETPPQGKEVIRVIREEKEVIRGFSQVIRTDSEVVRVIRGATNSRERPLLWEEVFLIHCYIYPLMGTVKRYRQLGLIDYQGNKHKTSLMDKGLIAMESVTTKSGRKKLMVPTRDGFVWLKERGFSISSDKEGSIEHNYWKRRLSAQFERMGYDVSLEVSLGHNRSVDLLVSSVGKQVCVEVETGKNSKEQMQANIAKGIEHADAVVLLLLHGQKVEVAGNQRVAVVGKERECLEAVRRFIGDEK